jgi:hypothetical protein
MTDARSAQSDFSDVVKAVYDRLAFNRRAYGTAWTGELCDVEFILGPALERLQNQASTIAAFQRHYRTDYPGSPFEKGVST